MMLKSDRVNTPRRSYGHSQEFRADDADDSQPLTIRAMGLPEANKLRIEDAVARILDAVGEDVHREGLLNTPGRVARMYDELLSGYRMDAKAVVNNALFEVEYDDMVMVRDIEFSSLCEHHLLPFLGFAHVAYIPNGKVIGLSKIPRIVDLFARRLQLQERLTHQIASFIDEILDTKGVAVVIEAKHMCSLMRGVEKQHSSMTTSRLMGQFASEEQVRRTFFDHLNRRVNAL